MKIEERKKINTVKELEAELAMYNGTEGYYIMFAGSPLSFTDGVRAMAIAADAFWLITMIESHMPEILRNRRLREFALVRFESGYGSGTLEILEDAFDEDGEPSKPIISQDVPLTDFPEGVFEMFLEQGVLLLKSEH